MLILQVAHDPLMFALQDVCRRLPAIAAAIYLVILTHEGGHGIAAYLGGLRILSFRIGPVRYRHSLWPDQPEGVAWELIRNSNSWFSGGIRVCATKKSMTGTLPRYVTMLLAGSLANTIAGLIVLANLRPGPAIGVAEPFAWISILGGFPNLLPIRTRSMETDGRRVLDVLSSKTRRKETLFWMTARERLRQIRSLAEEDRIAEAIVQTEDLIKTAETFPRFKPEEENMLAFFADVLRTLRLANVQQGTNSLSAAETPIEEANAAEP